MYGQLYMVHIEVCIIEAAAHHYPANESLQATQYKKDDNGNNHLLIKVSLQQKVYETNGKYYSQHTRPKAMKPLPEKYKLEITQRKIAVEIFILAYVLVAVEGLVPFFFIERGYCTHYRFPFGDGKAGACEPRDTAKQCLHNDHKNTQ